MYSVLTGGAFQSIGQTMERRHEMNQPENLSILNRESSKESNSLRYDRLKRRSLDLENEDFSSRNISRVPKQTDPMKIPVLVRPDQPLYMHQSDQPTYQSEYYDPSKNAPPKHIYIIEKHIPYPPTTEKNPVSDKCDCFENCSSEHKLKALKMYTSCCEKCRELFLSNFSDNCKCPKNTRKPKQELRVESIESEEGLGSKIQKLKELKGNEKSCNCSEQTKFNINISNQNSASANIGDSSKVKVHKLKKPASEENKSLKESDLKKILRILRRNSLKERKERPPPQCVKICSAEMEKLEKNISDLRKLRKKLRLPVHKTDREECSDSSSSVDLNEDIYLRKVKNSRKPVRKSISRSSSEELPEKENCGNRKSKKKNQCGKHNGKQYYKSEYLQSVLDKQSCGEISVQLIEALKTCSSNSDESKSYENSQNKSECSYEQIHRYNFPIPKIPRGGSKNGTRSGRYRKGN